MDSQTGAIPTQVPQQSGGSAEDLLKNLYSAHKSISEEIAGSLKQALAPMSSSGKGTDPALTMTPSPGYQQQPMNTREGVGAKNAKWQGIGNVSTAAANIIGQQLEKRNQEKQRSLAIDIERIYETTAGINEAKEAIKNDPSNQEAKQALAKNQGIQNALLSDPKKQKQFEKAFNVNFIDPSKNVGMEHEARKEAAKSYSDQLQAKTAQRMVPNVQALQKVAALQEQQKSIEKMVVSATSTANNEATNAAHIQVERENNAAKVGIAVAGDETKKEIAGANISARDAAAKRTDDVRVRIAKMQTNAHLTGIDRQIASREKIASGKEDEFYAKMDKTSNNPKAMYSVLTSELSTGAKVIKDGQDIIDHAKAELESASKTKGFFGLGGLKDPEAAKAAQERVDVLQNLMDNSVTHFKEVQVKLKELRDGGKLDGKSGNNTKSSSSERFTKESNSSIVATPAPTQGIEKPKSFIVSPDDDDTENNNSWNQNW